MYVSMSHGIKVEMLQLSDVKFIRKNKLYSGWRDKNYLRLDTL